MAQQSITCPNCGKKIQLTEAFTQQIEEKLRREFDAETKKKEREFERALEEREREFTEKLAGERSKLEKQAKKRAEEALSVEIADLKSQLEQRAEQLEEARKQELALRRRQRELEERERTLKLEVERTLDNERKKIWKDATDKVSEERRLKDLEKDKKLADLQKEIEQLKRKAEQGSELAQGEILELELEEVLRTNFRFDGIEPVAKGARGADVLQRVRTEAGRPCGTILWEAKRAKSWSEAWIQKLKDDQRGARAELAVLVSSILPKEIGHIGHIDGVWVTDFPSAVGLATALRASLIELAQARNALAGKSGKMELIYNYLSGPEFKQRVEAIVEAFVAMRDDLDAEKRAIEKVWAKRERQIQRVVQSTAGMYGDLQGIIGASLPEIKLLELPTGDSEDAYPAT